jgi:hypothetical protein
MIRSQKVARIDPGLRLTKMPNYLQMLWQSLRPMPPIALHIRSAGNA